MYQFIGFNVHMKENNSSDDFDSTLKYVEPKVQKLSNYIENCHLRKYERDRFKIIESIWMQKYEIQKNKLKKTKIKKNWLEKKRQITILAKANCPNQNTINLSNKELSSASKSLLSKYPNFVPTPYDINWYIFKQGFDNFMSKLRFHYLNATSTVTDTTVDNNKQALDEPPPKKVEKNNNFQVKTTSLHNLEAFMEKTQHILFQPLNHNKNVFHVTKNERAALKEITT